MMHAYGRDIKEVLKWTYPQLRLLGRYQAARIKDERRWQLVMAGGSMGQEAFDSLWEMLGGDPVDRVSSGGGSSSSGPRQRQQSLPVDRHGNVIAPAGAVRLADMTGDHLNVGRFSIPVATRWVDNDGNPVDPPTKEKKPDGP